MSSPIQVNGEVKPKPRAQRVKLTPEKFASLQEVGTRPTQRTIPEDHRDRLVAAGYVREVIRKSGGVSALALTGRGITRQAVGK